MSTRLPNHSPIGIDFGGHSIKAVQLARGRGNRWRLHAALNVPRREVGKPVDAAETLRLVAAFDRAGFVGDRAVVAVPKAELMTAMLELPPRAPGVPFDQIARMEFARVNKCEPAAMELACWDLPAPARASKASYVMAAGCAHATADRYLDGVEEGGLDVVAMDFGTSAVARACAPLLQQRSNQSTAILDIGYGAASVILVQNGMLTYERVMGEAGVRSLASALGKQLELDEAEIDFVIRDSGFGEPGDRRGAEQFADTRRVITAHFAPLVHEVRLTFGYNEHQYPDAPVDALLLLGGGAAIPGLAAHLRAALEVDVRVVTPTEVVECPADLMARATPALMTAFGLAQFGHHE
jgi:type IV pilus assembly protein PilM